MAGFRGMSRSQIDVPAARRNAARLSMIAESILGNVFKLNEIGQLSIDLIKIAGAGLEVFGGQLQIDLRDTLPGLELSPTGLGLLVGNGLEITAAGVEMLLANNPALEFSLGGLQVQVKTAGGIIRDIDGLSINPAEINTGGDLSGTISNANVIKIQGNAVTTAIPTNSQVYSWNATTAQFELTDPSGVVLGGDLSGPPSDAIVIGIQGNAVTTAIPADNQVYSWNATTAQFELNLPSSPDLRDTFPGLEISPTGLGLLVGNGLEITAAGAEILLATNPALEFSLGRIQVQVKATGGIIRDINGLSINPAEIISGGDISGPVSATTVTGIQTHPVKAGEIPLQGQFYTWDALANQFKLTSQSIVTIEYDKKVILARSSDTGNLSTSFGSIPWDTQIDIDPAFSHSTITNPEEITVNASTGIQFDIDITGSITTGTGTVLNSFTVQLQQNQGTGYVTFPLSLCAGAILRVSNVAHDSTAHISYSLAKNQVNAGDKFRVQVKKTSSTNAVVVGGLTRFRAITISDGSI